MVNTIKRPKDGMFKPIEIIKEKFTINFTFKQPIFSISKT